MTEAFTDLELDLVFFVERFAASTGQSPTDAQIKSRFDVTDEQLESFKKNKLVQKSFKARGIVYPSASDVLTDQQMHAIATMLDPLDRRSDAKKLADIGITTRQWSTWILDDKFQEYLSDRSERLLQGSVHEAHKGLIKGARNGNVAAAKALHEITGRYKSGEEAQIDVRRLLFTFIEVLQKHVKDPIVLHHVARELSEVANAETLSTGLAKQMTASGNFRRPELVSGSVVPTEVPLNLRDDE